MQRTRVGATVAGAIVLAALFAIPPSAAPIAAAPLTPIPAGSERLPIGPPFVAVAAGSVLRAAHPAPPVAAPAPASVTVPRATTFVAAVPTGPQGIPVPVLDAYKHAPELLARSDASCHLDWTLLAGIGRIESGHAYGGRVDDKGNTRGKILGPRLDGSHPGTAVITDSDSGAMDDDREFDRATGPMQFLPGTWRAYGADGNGDGGADANNIYDAAAGAGRYLCLGAGDLRELEDVKKALYRYNPSEAYGVSVVEWAEAYRNGTTPVPPRKDPVPTAAAQASVASAAPTEDVPAALAGATAPADAPPDGSPTPATTVQAAAPGADQSAGSTSSPPADAVATAPLPPAGAAPTTPGLPDTPQATAQPATPSAAVAPTGSTSSPVTPPAADAAAVAPPSAGAAPTTPGVPETAQATPQPATPAAAAGSTSSPATPPAADAAAVAPSPAGVAPTTPAMPETPQATPQPAPPAPPTAAAPQCPTASVVLEPEAVRVLPDGSILLRFAVPAGCAVTAATLQFTPGAADLDQPLEIRRVTGEWSQDTTEAPETAQPALTAAVPAAPGVRSVPVTALIAAGGTGLLLRTSADLAAPVQLTVSVG